MKFIRGSELAYMGLLYDPPAQEDVRMFLQSLVGKVTDLSMSLDVVCNKHVPMSRATRRAVLKTTRDVAEYFVDAATMALQKLEAEPWYTTQPEDAQK